ncbi:MAG TPA: HepT-like ribonuclease domain-containing protein [Candidatus Dormibacteraeota bacterium]
MTLRTGEPAYECFQAMRASARKAVAYAEAAGDGWDREELVVDAIANRVSEVADLAKYQFPAEEKDTYPQVPWDDLATAREFFTHQYSRLDPDRLRELVENALPDLIDAINELGISVRTDDDEPADLDL